MNNKLRNYRHSYQLWRDTLSTANKNKAPKYVKAQIMRNLNRSRNRLAKEMKRVAWLLWPETGRPYMGSWIVITSRNSRPFYSGTMADCINFINASQYGIYYRITKQSS
jgi:hypothetical protein